MISDVLIDAVERINSYLYVEKDCVAIYCGNEKKKIEALRDEMKALAFDLSRLYEDKESGVSCASTDISLPPNAYHQPPPENQREHRGGGSRSDV